MPGPVLDEERSAIGTLMGKFEGAFFARVSRAFGEKRFPPAPTSSGPESLLLGEEWGDESFFPGGRRVRGRLSKPPRKGG